MARIDRSTARKLFESGHPVRMVTDRGYSRLGYNSAASRYFGADSFEKFEELGARHDGEGVNWERPGPSRQTRDEAAGHIFRRESFRIGNLSGELEPGRIEVGDLPEKYVDQLTADMRDIGIHYVVWSYQTVIAWVRRNGHSWGDVEGGGITIPPVRYSNTTTQHQHMVARALGQRFTSTESARKGKGRTPYTESWQSRKWG